MITFKALSGMTPKFISGLSSVYQPSGTFRSSLGYHLIVVNCATEFYGNRSFAFAAAQLWNNLPANIRLAPSLGTFESRLKTHFFCCFTGRTDFNY
ncbi:hypothetical protein HOLleu_30894 [Holothuria leucospilota]|uniref:Uncharacterized protein n=1 Tax=Holothuria leucospilota TaxID=206669 RepID=A0A9Q1H076_HOLLE|nr:hypothetical protein HOLleu_30894 [Holothuria leucospilota]